MFYSNRRLNLHIGEMVISGEGDTVIIYFSFCFLKTQFTEMTHLDDCFQGVCACGQRRIQDEEAPRRAPKRRQTQRKYVASAFPLPASPGYATVHRWAQIAVSNASESKAESLPASYPFHCRLQFPTPESLDLFVNRFPERRDHLQKFSDSQN